MITSLVPDKKILYYFSHYGLPFLIFISFMNLSLGKMLEDRGHKTLVIIIPSRTRKKFFISSVTECIKILGLALELQNIHLLVSNLKFL